MIFSIADHITQIIKETKTQTRRSSSFYQVGSLCAIQPKRATKGILAGKIEILEKKPELRGQLISSEDAEAEGGYSVEEFEKLYAKMYPFWYVRWVYTFKFIKNKLAYTLDNFKC